MSGSVENLGKEAQEEAIKLSVTGMSAQAITDQLNSKYNSTLSLREVQSYLRRRKNKTIKIIKEDKKFQDKMVEQYFDTIQQMKDLNAEMWKLFYDLKNNPELIFKTITCPECEKEITIKIKNYQTLLKTSEVLLNQIRHVDAVLGKLNKKSLNITYNYVDLSKKIAIAMPKILIDLEKKGMIKVNKTRLKKYYTDEPMIDEDEPEEDLENL